MVISGPKGVRALVGDKIRRSVWKTFWWQISNSIWYEIRVHLYEQIQVQGGDAVGREVWKQVHEEWA